MNEDTGSTLPLFCLIRFLLYFSHWLVLAYLPVVLDDLAFPGPAVGLCISLYSVSSMALMPVMGLGADLVSPRRLLMAGALVMATSFALFPRLHAPYAVAAAILGAGFGAATLIVVSEALFLKVGTAGRLGRRVAFFQAATYAGFGTGPLVGGFLLPHGPGALFTTAATGCALIFLCGLLVPDAGAIAFDMKSYRSDLRRPKALLLCALIFVLGTHFGVEQTSFSLLLTRELHFTLPGLGVVFACLGLWMGLLAPLAGRLHDKKKSLFIFLVGGMAVSGLFQMLTPMAHSLAAVLAVRLLHTAGDTLALLELTIITARVFPNARLGGNSGAMYASRTLATFAAAIAAGYANRYGYGMSFLLNGAFVLACSLGVFFFIITGKDRRAALGWT